MPRVLLTAALAAAALTSAAGAEERLPAASSDDHLWFVVERAQPTPRVELRHAARDAGAHYADTMTLPRKPEAMAAWGPQLWLVFEAEPGGKRDAFTVQVERNPALDNWYFKPHDRLRAVTALPAEGALVSLVGAPRGPIALMASRTSPGAIGPTPDVTLHQLRGREWVPLDLPPKARGVLGLGVAGDDGRHLVLLTRAASPRRLAAWWRDAEEQWTADAEIEVDSRQLVAATRVGPNLAIITARPDAGRLHVQYLRRTRLLGLTGFAEPQPPWALVGLRDGLRVLEQHGGEITMTSIDGVTGVIGVADAMSPQPLMTGRVLHRPLLFALAITALMLVFLFRPNSKAGEVALPATMVILSPGGRAMAVAVDLAVSGVVTIVILGCGLGDLTQLPMLTADLVASVPYIIMSALTVAHSTVSELIWQRTIGKSLVGARVTSLDGSKPPASAILVRNAFKALVLLIPVLAVFSLLSPHLQGLGDSMARTVVVGPAPPAESGAGKDR